MEERVGLLWHRLITRAARTEFPEARVELTEVQKALGVTFRAMGGDPGLRIEAASPQAHHARRGWLQRIAGSQRRVELGSRDEEALRLPGRIEAFPERRLNRDLYIWLAVLAARDFGVRGPWFHHNQRLSREVLARYPGLLPRYRRLVAAQLALRPNPAGLPAEEAAQERAIRAALREPGSVEVLPHARRAPQPVHLWLDPFPPQSALASEPLLPDLGEPEAPSRREPQRNLRRRRAERAEAPEREGGLLTLRFEHIFSWAEFVKVDRGTDEDEDEQAAEVAEDLDVLHVARDSRPVASRLRFDLDLPSEANDDRPLGEGILLPEWHYKKQRMQPDHCRLQPMVAADAVPCELPPHLRAVARHLRAQFEALVPSRVWHRAQQDGAEVDLDAYLRYLADRRSGVAGAEQGLYRDMRNGSRELACLLLADLSLSTDAWVSNSARVIDVIRDSLFLFAEALGATRDRFAMYGFSSRRRDHVRLHVLKAFEESHGAPTRGRVAAIKPGYYTRMGAAIRHATGLLAKQKATQRLLLLLTDGKPNDLDQYGGRYGVEDTRMAILEARRAGLQPFCVTIDEHAGDYLPHLFGSGSFVVIRKPEELPRELPLLYARLTQ
jgi:nitric oxide reductase NorD protein